MGKFIICRVKSVHPIHLLGLATFLLIAIFGFILLANNSVFAASDEDSGRDRVVTIYDNDTEKTIITKASTVKGALSGAAISVSQYDSVDPAVDSKLEDSTVIVNIRRARPVLVTDGQREVRVITAAQTAADVAKSANIKLYAEDQTTLAPVNDILSSGGAGLELIIRRAKVVNMRLYGQEIQLRTQSKTVGDLLKEKQITLGVDDGISLSTDTPISDGMNLQVWRNGIQTINATETISFTTKTVQDATKNVGYKEIKTTGQNGEKTVVYQIEMRDGHEVSRSVISEVVNTPAVEQVEIIGSKLPTMAYRGGGSKSEWLAASKIPQDQWGYAEWLVQKESGWNPNSVNRSSGACGLGQQLPCGKWAGTWNNPVDSLNGMNTYVINRYGSWEAAVNHSKNKGWY